MMETTRTFFLVLLLNPLLVSSTDVDPEPSTILTPTSHSEERGGLTSAAGSDLPTADPQNSTGGAGGPRGDCLIDTEMGLIAVGSAGGLIVCLLIAIGVLVGQVCVLQRRVYIPRTSRSNMDLVSAAGYWATDRDETGGLVGPCDASVILEEVRADGSVEEEEEGREGIREAGEEGRREEGAAAAGRGPDEEEVPLMQGSTSRESCLEVPRDLEDMPLVV